MSYYDDLGNRGNQVAIIWITVTLNRMQSSILFRSFFLGSKIGLGRSVKILGAGCWWRPGRRSTAGNLPAPPTVPRLPSGADFHAFNTPFFYWFLPLQRKTHGKNSSNERSWNLSLVCFIDLSLSSLFLMVLCQALFLQPGSLSSLFSISHTPAHCSICS